MPYGHDHSIEFIWWFQPVPLPMEIVSHPGCISKPCQWNFAISRHGTCPWSTDSTATALQVPCGRTKNRCVMVYMVCYGLWETSLRRVFLDLFHPQNLKGSHLLLINAFLPSDEGIFVVHRENRLAPTWSSKGGAECQRIVKQSKQLMCCAGCHRMHITCVRYFCPSTNICIHWAQDGTGFHHPAKKTGNPSRPMPMLSNTLPMGINNTTYMSRNLNIWKLLKVVLSFLTQWNNSGKGEKSKQAVLQCRCNRSSSSFGHSQIHSIRTGTGIFHRSRLCIWEQLNFTSLWPSSAPAGMYEKKFKSSSFSMVPGGSCLTSGVQCLGLHSGAASGKL